MAINPLLPLAGLAAGALFLLRGGKKKSKEVHAGEAYRLTFKLGHPLTSDERTELAFNFTSANAAALNQIFNPSWSSDGMTYTVTVKYRSPTVLPVGGEVEIPPFRPTLVKVERVYLPDEGGSEPATPVSPTDDASVVSPAPAVQPPEESPAIPVGPQGPDPAELARRIAQAVQDGPAAMRQTAAWLDGIGTSDASEAATMLRMQADTVEAAEAAPPAPSPESVPTPQPAPAPEPPSAPQPAPALPAKPPEDPVREASVVVTDYLRALVRRYSSIAMARWHVNPDIIRNYQEKAGLDDDGLYGVDTALAIADKGIIPVTPMRFPRTNPQAAKERFKAAMKLEASQDPERAAQWLDAAKGIDIL